VVRTARRLAVLAVASCAAGCCVAPPPAEKFFDRKSCVGAFKGFVYGVDAEQWEYAFESLSASSRAEIGSTFRLRVAVKHLRDPVFRDVSMYDLISDSVRHYGLPREDGDHEGARGSLRVAPRVANRQGGITAYAVDLIFVKEEREWRLDLMESLRALESAVRNAAPNIARR
jgi:hypothetical protein